MAKIKIDLSEGVLEVEGEEAFLKEIYEDFKSRVNVISDSKVKQPAIEAEATSVDSKEKQAKGKMKTNTRKESYSFVKDLNLRGNGQDVESLKDFYAKKLPSSAMERTTVFVYYLCRFLKINNVGVGHIYTCYKEVGEKVPAALRQNLLDTAHRKGTIDTSSLDNVTLTTRGENMVELDLPPKEKKKD